MLFREKYGFKVGRELREEIISWDCDQLNKVDDKQGQAENETSPCRLVQRLPRLKKIRENGGCYWLLFDFEQTNYL